MIPQHAPSALRNLQHACLAFQAEFRPDADSLFKQALGSLEESDCALASVETSYTLSEPVPGVEDQQSLGQQIENLAPSVSLNAQPEKSLGSSLPHMKSNSGIRSNSSLEHREEASRVFPQSQQTSLSVSRSGLSAPSFRQSADSFYERQKNRGIQDPTSTSSLGQRAPGKFGDSEFSADREVGGGSVDEIYDWIGNFVTDYKIYPHMDMLPISNPGRKKQIMRVVRGTHISFTSIYVVPKTRRFLGVKHNKQSGIMVNIDADRCEEVILEHAKEHLNFSIDHGRRSWVEERKALGKTVYLILGYIVYLNALVSEKSVDSSRSKTAGATGAYPESSLIIGSSTQASNAFSKCHHSPSMSQEY